jgi:predicted dienelactone hydrolase
MPAALSLLRRPVPPIPALALGAILACASPVRAEDPDQVFELADPAGGRIEAAVWLPDAATPGAARPLVVVSHGNGGWYGGHHDTAEALAQAGFIVAALSHPGDNWRDQSRWNRLTERPGHLRLLLDHMTQDWPGPVAVDPGRIGAFGFSAGGFTVAAAIGGISDPSLIDRHCEAQPGVFVCRLLASDPIDAAAWRPRTPDPRIRAAVLAAPGMGMAFSAESLATVHVPVQLWQAAEDEVLPSPFHVEPIRDGLGGPVEFHRVEGAGHFDFLPPCPPELASGLPDLCRSRPGFDRAGFHEAFNAEVVRFFTAAL